MILSQHGVPYEAPHVWVPSRKIVRVPPRERGYSRQLPPYARREPRLLVPANVQSSGLRTADSASSLAFSFATLPTVGNYITISFARFSSSAPTLADNQGGSNTYTKAIESVGIGGGGNNKSEIWYSKVAASSGTFTVTISAAASSFLSGGFDEWSGLKASGVVDQTRGDQTAAASTTIGTGNITTTLNNELILACFCSGTLGDRTLTAPTGFTRLWSNGQGTLHEVGEGDYKVVSATGTYSATLTFDTSVLTATSCIASFFSDIPDATGRSQGYIIG